jgi:ATP-dependent Clp protease ATP-binding subunit ClpX
VVSKTSPRQIVEHLDRSVIGQGRAKRSLTIAVSNHFKRLLDLSDRGADDPVVADPGLRDVTIEKSNVILIGPSGSGKTHLARSLAEYLSVPFAVAGVTTLSEAGYVGEDVETVLHKLLLAANCDVQAAQRGIVFLDEIDKLRGGQSFGAKDMRLGVQHALLKVIEGTTCNVPPGGGNRHPLETCIPFDTSQVLFVCGGAFGGLDEVIARRLGRDQFGFDKAAGERRDGRESFLRHVLPEDLERYGMIPELLGRLPVVATLDDPGVEDLVRILREPKNSLLAQYKKLLKYHHADLEFTDGAVRAVAGIAHERGTGARGLRAVVEAVLEPVLFDPRPWVTYRITEAAVRGGEPEMADLGLPGWSAVEQANPALPLRHRLGRKSALGT